MLRVVHLITALDPGGAESMLLNLLSHMDGDRFEPAVITLTPPGRLRPPNGIPMHSLAIRPGIPNPLALGHLIRLLRSLRPHVLQTWLYHADFLGALAARPAGIRTLVWNVRCAELLPADTSVIFRGLLWTLARLSSLPAAIVVNSHAGRRASDRLGYRPKQWVHIPNGFDLTVFRPMPQLRRLVRRDLGLAADAFLIGLFARWDPMKDHATFFQAARVLHAAHPNVHFVLAGRGVVPDNPGLGTYLTPESFRERVHLLGERDDVHRLTAALDVATCASYTEGFPNVIGEAMACAVPCVATDVGDSRLMVGDTGIMVPPRDPQQMAEGWARVLALGSEARRELGARARERIAAHYDILKISEEYGRLYESLAAPRN